MEQNYIQSFHSSRSLWKKKITKIITNSFNDNFAATYYMMGENHNYIHKEKKTSPLQSPESST